MQHINSWSTFVTLDTESWILTCECACCRWWSV